MSAVTVEYKSVRATNHATEAEEGEQQKTQPVGPAFSQVYEDPTHAGEEKEGEEHQDGEGAGRVTCLARVGIGRLLYQFVTLYRGWKTYVRYSVALAGLALAFLYMTVLGFDNITVGESNFHPY